MSKFFTTFFLATCFLGLTLKPALALDVVVHPDGTTYFYDSRVLGDSDEAVVEQSETEKRPKNPAEVKRIKEESRPLRIVPRSDQAQIRLKTDRAKTEVILEKKTRDLSKSPSPKSEFERRESIETKDIKLEVPSADKREIEAKDEKRDELERKNEVIKKVLEERRERKEEKIQIQTEKREDGEVEFQFESRNVKAKLKEAEIVVDPVTNAVSITTPSGQQHTLLHLPDQAIEKMQQAGLIDATSDEFLTGEVELKTKSDGAVTYQIKQQKRRKIFGFIPRTVETEVELNDETGEVTETTVESNNLFTRFFNRLAK